MNKPIGPINPKHLKDIKDVMVEFSTEYNRVAISDLQKKVDAYIQKIIDNNLNKYEIVVPFVCTHLEAYSYYDGEECGIRIYASGLLKVNRDMVQYKKDLIKYEEEMQKYNEWIALEKQSKDEVEYKRLKRKFEGQ